MERVLAQIKMGRSTAGEIAKATGIRVPYVCKWTRLLEALGRIERLGIRRDGRPVRPSTIWRARPERIAS